MTKNEIFQKDLRETISRDFPETVKIGVKTFECLVEDFVGIEREEEGGPDPLGNTRVHLMMEDSPVIVIGTKCKLLERNLEQIIISTSLSPDKNHLILTTMDI